MSEDKVTLSKNHQDDEFDLNLFFLKVRRFWYVFVISIALGYLIARWYNWYATPYYKAETTILVKDESNANLSAEKLLHQLDGSPTEKNIGNEIEILKSRKIFREALNNSDFLVSYTLIGRLKTSDFYKRAPITLEYDSLHDKAYRSKIKLTIENNKFCTLKINKSNTTYSVPFNQNIKTEIGIIKISKNQLFNNKEILDPNFTNRDYEIKFNDIDALIDKYVKLIDVDYENKQGNVLMLSILETVPQRGTDLLDNIMQSYLKNDIYQKNKVASNTLKFIDDQLTVISTELKFIENDLERFKSGNNITDIGTEASLFLQNAQSVDMQNSQLLNKYRIADYLEKYIKGNNNLNELTPSVMGLDDPLLLSLLEELRKLEAQKNQYAIAAKTDNPIIISLNTQIEKTKESLLSSIISIKQNLKISIDNSKSTISKFENQIKNIPRNERALVTLKRQFTIKETMYLFLLQKRAETSIALASTISDSYVIDHAIASKNPVRPIPSKNYIIALILSLALPLIYIYIMYTQSDTIRDKYTLDKVNKIPILGAIGYNNNEEDNLITATKSKSAISEAFRSLRTNLQYFGNANKKIILITSSISGEGKTFTAINLACIFAMSGKKTVLLGLDLRKPKLGLNFNLSKDVGISNYLTSDISHNEIIQHSKLFDTLDIIISGPIPPNPSELILNKRMDELIASLTKDYDHIILDTPPIGLVTDALILNKYSDASIYIVRQGVTRKMHVVFANELFSQQKFNNLSLVFNAVKKDGLYGDYGYNYGYGYGYGYGYYEDDDIENEKWYNKLKNIVFKSKSA